MSTTSIRRRLALAALVIASATGPSGCTRRDARPEDLRIACAVTPDPPAVGAVVADLRITGPAGAAVSGAAVRIEANMTHAGMVPVIAPAREVEPGRYRATLQFGMAGDWYLDVEIRMADGRRVERIIPLPGVRGR